MQDHVKYPLHNLQQFLPSTCLLGDIVQALKCPLMLLVSNRQLQYQAAIYNFKELPLQKLSYLEARLCTSKATIPIGNIKMDTTPFLRNQRDRKKHKTLQVIFLLAIACYSCLLPLLVPAVAVVGSCPL